MTQHTARKMRLSRLGLPADVKVRRRFKSYIHNVIYKLNSLHYVWGIYYKGPPQRKPGEKKEGEKDRDRGRKSTHKIFTAELRKFAEVMKKLSKNAHN